MKIATFNINNINKRIDSLALWLAEESPDVVCLQELKAEQGHFPEETLKALGYHCIWAGQRSWNGVALLARTSRLRLLRMRSHALDIAVVMAALAGAFTCSAVLVLFLGAVRGGGAANLLYLFFGGGVVLTMGSLAAFVVEMLLAATGASDGGFQRRRQILASGRSPPEGQNAA